MGQHYTNLHILIIDADASAAYITRACVQRVAPEAICTIGLGSTSGVHDAREHPDVVIVDPPCHSLAAIRLVRSLKEVHPQAHVIVLASAPTPTLRRDMQHLGVDAYIEKPAPLAEIVVALTTCIERLDLAHTDPVSIANVVYQADT